MASTPWYQRRARRGEVERREGKRNGFGEGGDSSRVWLYTVQMNSPDPKMAYRAAEMIMNTCDPVDVGQVLMAKARRIMKKVKRYQRTGQIYIADPMVKVRGLGKPGRPSNRDRQEAEARGICQKLMEVMDAYEREGEGSGA